ncbi:hypothetical protein BIU82_00260 [Arthrobacter sp. SW1]|nr:hypothetical protein [Arthrobacter sp. SW1]OFI39550.1 hypothetical protein BIU82_00260 [Arthrobacter sp. SW1]
MHKHAGGRVIDGLHGGDELGVVRADHARDLGVEFPVAGETVELMDDDEVDVGIFGQVLQHGLETFAFHVRAGLASVDEFFDDHGAH